MLLYRFSVNEYYRETGNIKRVPARFHTRSNLNRDARKQSGSGKTETLLAFIRRWFVYRFGNSKLERYKGRTGSVARQLLIKLKTGREEV